ncbi:MAG: YHS domain-containing (seleno)protein [Bacteriovoracaceae bacterium]|nr:YHS domain-containing (seleno)protein [Bacteriovoracaceae bacterium]
MNNTINRNWSKSTKLETVFVLFCALIFLQTLFFKFTGAPESRYIFETLGIEPWGRYSSGFVELIASILLILPTTRIWGAVLGLGTMSGALLGHITKLGLVVQNDGGVLFVMALFCWLVCLFIVLKHKARILKLFLLPLLFILGGQQLINSNEAYAASSLNTEGKENLAVQGYDVLSYYDNNPTEGNPQFSFKYETATYQFSSQEHLDQFKKDPAKYVPVFGGWCAYAMADGEKVAINPKTYKIIDGKIYLFYNRFFTNTLTKWNKDEPNLKTKAEAAWKKLQ